jgi:hypothetical protein
MRRVGFGAVEAQRTGAALDAILAAKGEIAG